MTEKHINIPRSLRILLNNAKKGNILSQFEIYDYYKREENNKEASNHLNLINQSMSQARFIIKKLNLYEFRRYRELSIELDKKLTVIIGENGSGKTSIVESIARLLSWFSSRLIKSNSNGLHILESDIHISARDYSQVDGLFSLNEESNFNVSLVKSLKGWPGDISSHLQATTQLGSLYRLLAASKENTQVQLPIFAFYGVERAFTPPSRAVNDTELRAFFKSRFNAYTEYSDANTKIDIFLSRYIELFNLSEHSDNHYKEKLRLVNRAIETAVPFIEKIGIDRSSGLTEVKLNNFTYRINFHQLSQGQKILAALVGDLCLRMLTLNPEMPNPLHAQGIVLIDEIELHLHPKWQQLILLSLTETFNNIQFIVTTHSPHVLSTVDKDNIRILRSELDGVAYVEKPTFQTKGVISSQVLEQLMETHSIPMIEESSWITTYQNMIEADKWETSTEGQLLHTKLLSHFGSDHPVIKDLETRIRLRNFKRRVEKKLED